MNFLISILVVVLEALACVGIGAVLLRGLGLADRLGALERITWSFALGFGGLGWLLFFFGIFGWLIKPALLLLLIIGACGVLTLRGIPAAADFPNPSGPESSAWKWTLVAMLVAVLFFDFMEGLSPPVDADTLAYHFTLPKLYLESGSIIHFPRASTGAAPYLTQMTYVPVLGLGGEAALTLWTMLSGWAVALLIFTVAGRFMDRTWSLATALVFLTLPATLYGAGSGQVEVRIVLMTLTAGASIGLAAKTGLLRYTVAAGIATGFFMASKYTGLLFVASAGFVVLMQRRWFVHGAVFGLAVLATGSQWYLWNWAYTGDPVWPMLTGWLGLGDSDIWSVEFHRWFKEGMFGSNVAVPASLYWFVVYPFKATVDGLPIFESGRTGLGPIWLLVLPFALLGAWQARRRIIDSPLARMALIALFFYAFWFFTRSSQRIRFLLPLAPLLLIPVTVAALHCAEKFRLRRELIAAFMVCLVIQLGGHALFSLSYTKYLITGQSRESFLEQNIPAYAIAQWINANLTHDDKVLTTTRHLSFHIDVPIYVALHYNQTLIDLRPSATTDAYYRQIRALGISHIIIGRPNAGQTEIETSARLALGLLTAGCAKIVAEFPSATFLSRTLRGDKVGSDTLMALRVLPEACKL